MNSDQQWGEYRGVRFEHACDGGGDSRSGIIHFPDDPRRHVVADGGGARWEEAARALIDRYFHDIDIEPDDDSEA
ncbi:hypothetical protein ISP15_16335 [Dyella jejuensis]|uniref:Uncharacterized protein n=1 Tax=Dyella jejuensis TaxID=1432009 RepID=A0ABW8JLA6_9GAMM